MSEQETSGEDSNGESPHASPACNAEESNGEPAEDTVISDEGLLLQNSWYIVYKRSRRGMDDPVFPFLGGPRLRWLPFNRLYHYNSYTRGS